MLASLYTSRIDLHVYPMSRSIGYVFSNLVRAQCYLNVTCNNVEALGLFLHVSVILHNPQQAVFRTVHTQNPAASSFWRITQ
jgi:hypothetical protein